ncbi:hypothetical protein SKAU_G00103640 [Synaphobranchus kaupii]|uniref:Uncharacterized protein n=1 Tax=Synaphobranchus kaupii TaxID=118154 RepID=A0A9Q1J7N5_SYNKA|nr:hypothetical protein SKAU_G00103640 [Synaphobranchus kaupii]
MLSISRGAAICLETLLTFPRLKTELPPPCRSSGSSGPLSGPFPKTPSSSVSGLGCLWDELSKTHASPFRRRGRAWPEIPKLSPFVGWLLPRVRPVTPEGCSQD